MMMTRSEIFYAAHAIAREIRDAIACSNVSEGELNELLQKLFEQLKKLTPEYMGDMRHIKGDKA